MLTKFTLPRATIPDVNTYDKLHATTNTLMCPLLILLFFNDFVEFGMPVGVFGEGSVPLWSLVLLQSFFLAMAQWYMTDWVSLPVWMERIYLSLSFVCSIAWISIFAQVRAVPCHPGESENQLRMLMGEDTCLSSLKAVGRAGTGSRPVLGVWVGMFPGAEAELQNQLVFRWKSRFLWGFPIAVQ